jgi:hypothetical protein
MDENKVPNPPAEPAYSAPTPEAPKTDEIVLPAEPEEHDDEPFDDEVGTAEDIQADFDTEETNAKEVSP